MNHLFLKDSFSQKGPNWGKDNLVDHKNFSYLTELINENYNNNIGQVKSLFCLDSFNINSNNFLCKGKKTDALIKVITRNTREKKKKLQL